MRYDRVIHGKSQMMDAQWKPIYPYVSDQINHGFWFFDFMISFGSSWFVDETKYWAKCFHLRKFVFSGKIWVGKSIKENSSEIPRKLAAENMLRKFFFGKSPSESVFYGKFTSEKPLRENFLRKICYRKFASKNLLEKIRFNKFVEENLLKKINWGKFVAENSLKKIRWGKFASKNALRNIHLEKFVVEN